METLGISIVDVGEDFVEGAMTVSPKLHQPSGLLHGGANVALAESLGSMGSVILLNDAALHVVGIEINANHLRSLSSGVVHGRAEIVHKGSRTHVWEIKIRDESGKLLSTCRMTNMIIQASR